MHNLFTPLSIPRAVLDFVKVAAVGSFSAASRRRETHPAPSLRPGGGWGRPGAWGRHLRQPQHWHTGSLEGVCEKSPKRKSLNSVSPTKVWGARHPLTVPHPQEAAAAAQCPAGWGLGGGLGSVWETDSPGRARAPRLAHPSGAQTSPLARCPAALKGGVSTRIGHWTRFLPSRCGHSSEQDHPPVPKPVPDTRPRSGCSLSGCSQPHVACGCARPRAGLQPLMRKLCWTCTRLH